MIGPSYFPGLAWLGNVLARRCLMRLATCEVSGTVAAGVIGDDGFHPLPDDATILDLVRSGLPAALDALSGLPDLPQQAMRPPHPRA